MDTHFCSSIHEWCRDDYNYVANWLDISLLVIISKHTCTVVCQQPRKQKMRGTQVCYSLVL